MKQAILITAYHQIDLLRKIVAFFDEDFDIYIHIDKKCRESYGDIATERVHVYSKYKIYWGSEYHLFAIMDLVKEAHKNGPYSYYHLITGNDFPIKPLAEFKSFFSENNHVNYLEYHSLPRSSWCDEGGIGRVRYYWIGNQLFDIRKHNRILNRLLWIQRKLGVKRRFVKKYSHLYGGGTYWSLTEEAVGVLLEHKGELPLMRFTHCAEEIFVQTVLLNHNRELPVENKSLRYMRWCDTAQSPIILDENHFHYIRSSICFFCRKVDANVSWGLMKKISSILS